MKDIAIYGAGGFGREVACLIGHIIESDGPKWNIVGFFRRWQGQGLRHRLRPGAWRYGRSQCLPGPAFRSDCHRHTANTEASRRKNRQPQYRFPQPDCTQRYVLRPRVDEYGARQYHNVRLPSELQYEPRGFQHTQRLHILRPRCPHRRFQRSYARGQVVGRSLCRRYEPFGGRSFIAQQVRVGNNTTIGAGSVVLRRTKDNSLYLGNPAKKIEI